MFKLKKPAPKPFPYWLNIQIEDDKVSFFIKPLPDESPLFFNEDDFAELFPHVVTYRPSAIVFEYVKLNNFKLEINFKTLLDFEFLQILDFGGPPYFFFSTVLDQVGLDTIVRLFANNNNISGLRLSCAGLYVNTDAIAEMIRQNKTIQSLSIKFKDKSYNILRTILSFNTTIQEIYLTADPPPILHGLASPIKFDFSELARDFVIPYANHSALRKIHFANGKFFEHTAGVKIHKDPKKPATPYLLSSPLL